jgi:hypothetical protein
VMWIIVHRIQVAEYVFYNKTFINNQKLSGKIFSKYVVSLVIITLKFLTMRSILYIIAVILIIGWLLGVFAWHAGGLIHILIVIAVIALLLAIIRRA